MDVILSHRKMIMRELDVCRNFHALYEVFGIQKTAQLSGGLMVGLGGLEPLTFTMSIR